jgi:hypothetical protein
MAEDGRLSERGHCLLALPRAVWLVITRVLVRPARWRTAWLAADPIEPAAAGDDEDPVDQAHADTVAVVGPADGWHRDGVTRHLKFGVVGAHATFVGNLRYRRDEPYAVQAVFNDGGDIITWRFGRELLHTAVIDRKHAGDGDVQMYELGTMTLALALSSHDGSIVLTVPYIEASLFLRETYTVVARGRESEHLGLDEALAELLSKEAL